MATLAPGVVGRAVCTTFDPLFNILAEAWPVEAEAEAEEGLVLPHVPTTGSSMVMAEYGMAECWGHKDKTNIFATLEDGFKED